MGDRKDCEQSLACDKKLRSLLQSSRQKHLRPGGTETKMVEKTDQSQRLKLGIDFSL